MKEHCFNGFGGDHSPAETDSQNLSQLDIKKICIDDYFFSTRHVLVFHDSHFQSEYFLLFINRKFQTTLIKIIVRERRFSIVESLYLHSHGQIFSFTRTHTVFPARRRSRHIKPIQESGE